LISTLVNLKGNPRATVFTEPLWGIPFNLYSPYASIFMLALGVNDAQIGAIASLSMFLQTVFALLSGPITDRLGRRKTTFYFDMLSWSIPTIIWAFAQDIRYFILAAIVNATWRITMNSWTCLLVEDADSDQLVHIWTWIYIAGLLSAFFAPLAGVLINATGLVSGVRLLYIFAFLFMTLKFFLLFKYSKETQQGLSRLEEARDHKLLNQLQEYWGVLMRLFRTPQLLVILGMMVVISITRLVDGTFWSIIVTERLGIPVEDLAWFPFARSILLLILFFTLSARMNIRNFRTPMLLGLAGYIGSKIMLVTMPAGSYILLLISVLIDAFSFAIFGPLMDSLVVVAIPAEERARINAIIAVVVIITTSPFGWVAGQLSEVNRTFPFILNMFLYMLGMGLVVYAWRLVRTPRPEMLAVSID